MSSCSVDMFGKMHYFKGWVRTQTYKCNPLTTALTFYNCNIHMNNTNVTQQKLYYDGGHDDNDIDDNDNNSKQCTQQIFTNGVISIRSMGINKNPVAH